ncbi:hypothetical protein [Flexithrix dorotheae]|uniref:hypothetical protein n=1 Tax=Flexithrix dorotheae TaxID=70993 RepID=UPI00037CFB9E|nr:hypothetical protein [Flexithrix dorotheae]
MKKVIFYLSVFTLIFFSSSCEEDLFNGDANLTVIVKGALSGNLRDNITVRIYTNREDAEELNSSFRKAKTDSNGEAYLERIPAGRTLFVRADALFAKTIRELPILQKGENTFEMVIL